jgi:hypothetical protein
LSVWKNSKNTLPLAPSGTWTGKNSPKYLRFSAVLPFEKSRKTEFEASTFTPSIYTLLPVNSQQQDASRDMTGLSEVAQGKTLARKHLRTP